MEVTNLTKNQMEALTKKPNKTVNFFGRKFRGEARKYPSVCDFAKV